MFAMVGFVIADGGEATEGTAISSYELADMMLEARKTKDETGIVAVKRSSTKKEK
jgi:hypothetical protein